tara:strand:+ start:4135 stop:4407 length:273 start_codon:yes stop_codon:yes gene_type:complete
MYKMAAGDVVVDLITSTGDYQPASGVEVCLTGTSTTGGGDEYAINDGTSTAQIVGQSQTGRTIRVYIDNTNYLTYTKSALNAFYTGVQVG